LPDQPAATTNSTSRNRSKRRARAHAPLARYPSLFELNTRVRLSELAADLGRPATLDDLTDAELDGLAADGFDLVWLLGVWQTGEAGRRVSIGNTALRNEYRRVLPDYRESDVCGSCFAVQDYHVHRDFGGDGALAHLRERLRDRGLRLILDFVPNHMGLDHRWVQEHPDYFVEGSRAQLAAEPDNFCRLNTPSGSRIFAYGRDPYFPGWSDTLQLNYGNPAVQDAMIDELQRISAQCDGLRCDMAMLLLPEVFERTWGIDAEPFWPRAIPDVRAQRPGFIFLAEVYWDLEWTLQQQGFDYTYDKRLYDRLVQGLSTPVREHLSAGLDYQDHLARFLENHDELRAAAAFEPEVHRAAAVITYLSPGLRFLHQGQREGRKARIPVQLARGPVEAPDAEIAAFYAGLLARLRDPAYRAGDWQLLEARRAWEGDATNEAFIAFSWTGPGQPRRLVAVNYSQHRSQCYLTLPWDDLSGRGWRLVDRLGPVSYDRAGDDLTARGLYLDMPPWGYHAFDVEPG
jgi:glycosidase